MSLWLSMRVWTWMLQLHTVTHIHYMLYPTHHDHFFIIVNNYVLLLRFLQWFQHLSVLIMGQLHISKEIGVFGNRLSVLCLLRVATVCDEINFYDWYLCWPSINRHQMNNHPYIHHVAWLICSYLICNKKLTRTLSNSELICLSRTPCNLVYLADFFSCCKSGICKIRIT